MGTVILALPVMTQLNELLVSSGAKTGLGEMLAVIAKNARLGELVNCVHGAWWLCQDWGSVTPMGLEAVGGVG